MPSPPKEVLFSKDEIRGIEKGHKKRLETTYTVKEEGLYQCPVGDSTLVRNDFHMRGTALGGWLVLEPWITPSLFYQFLGASQKWGDDAQNKVGLDSYTFCKALGKEEANRQLRRHWESWVTEGQIKYMAQNGLDTVRIPVGDWMYVPYEPYIGCMDGASEQLQRVIRLCEKYDMKVILDIHAARGSQNGLDNSGNTGHMKWVSKMSTGGSAKYEHWEMRGGDWAGHYNDTTHQYDSIDYDNIQFTLTVVEKLINTHKDDSTVIGIEPLNEPWWPTPIDVLKKFYWDSYNLVQKLSPTWITLLHDSFRLTPGIWGDFLTNCNNYAMDTHIYQAWAWAMPPDWFEDHACADGEMIRIMEAIGVPVIVGEWSLATDNCAMWLNGFNDNVPGYPKVECERVKCPPSYMGDDQPGTPLDDSLPPQDPFGTGGESYVSYGTCPRDKPFENDDKVMTALGYSKINAFDLGTHGNFFWNFRTEFEPRWDFQQASTKKWLPSSYENEEHAQIVAACPYHIYSEPHSSPSSSKSTKPSIRPTTSVKPTNLQSTEMSYNTFSSMTYFFLLIAILSANVYAALYVYRRSKRSNSSKYVSLENFELPLRNEISNRKESTANDDAENLRIEYKTYQTV